MTQIPNDLRFTRSHEWVRALPDGRLEIGITDHAQNALGDLVFVEVPAVGRALAAGEAMAVVESVKAASDVYSPVSGKVIASNSALTSHPELVNQDPYGAGWLVRIEADSPQSAAAMLDGAGYAGYIANETK
jgi:glycine cleavage system H protein